ncbi:uncharacterized protein LOC131146279 isoform X2 [Malania oleifera]|uniref:uncharacterized protein LOC131146279 isoform X2 n=1 Tax=Malania oleifera TaxID=397392 RepID=UPI0025AE2061|nr:uncharacterized protein LOC131146279 isoform X2 [Malania oleifera]
MAAPSSPSSSPNSVSKSTLSIRYGIHKNKNKRKSHESMPNDEKTLTESAVAGLQRLSRRSPSSRTKSPGVRLIHGRIYDSENGKSCHQCRQKTMDFAVTCTKKGENEQCPLHFCHKCLLNRYGEKAEDMAVLGSWLCPKCRGICNCSFCMKKRGHRPTGVLARTAKATGFSSVSDMLRVKGTVGFCSENRIIDAVDSSKEKIASNELKELKSKDHSEKGGKSNTGYSRKGNDDENGCKRNKADDALTETCLKKSQISMEVSKHAEEIHRNDNAQQCTHHCYSPTTRRKSSLLQLSAGRVDNSEDGKSCHWCHNKTMGPLVSCQNHSGSRQCALNFCHLCLLNRFGEKLEDKAVLNEWKCPKCRGRCDCSLCMKKQQHQSTGKLVHTAIGIRSLTVLEENHVNDSENFGFEKMMMEVSVSEEKQTAANEEFAVASTKVCREENGKSDSSLQFNPLKFNADDEENEDSKMKKSRKNDVNFNECKGSGDADASKEKSCPKKCQSSKEVSAKEGKFYDRGGDDRLVKITSDRNIPLRTSPGSININDNETVEPNNVDIDNDVETPRKGSDFEVLLPQGIELKNVADIDIPAQDVGHALQFLEFCKAFGQVLDLKRGQPELLLRELACGRNKRRIQDSPIVQFHIQLLSMIHKDSQKEHTSCSHTIDGNSWLEALRKCISESKYPLEELQLDCFDVSDDGYDKLNLSTKLRILNFLCDEALGTVNLRKWIDEQNSKFIEKAKEEAFAAKEKQKSMMRRLQDEVTRVMLAKNGAPLSISEHEDLVSKIKTEVQHNLAGTQEATDREPISFEDDASGLMIEDKCWHAISSIYFFWNLC